MRGRTLIFAWSWDLCKQGKILTTGSPLYLFVCLFISSFVCLPEVGDLLLASRAGVFWNESVFVKWMVSPPSWILTETEDEARVQHASCTTKRRYKRIHHLAITCPALKRLDIKCLLFKLIFFRFRLISFRFFSYSSSVLLWVNERQCGRFKYITNLLTYTI